VVLSPGQKLGLLGQWERQVDVDQGADGGDESDPRAGGAGGGAEANLRAGCRPGEVRRAENLKVVVYAAHDRAGPVD